jgi:hypothetical protein
VKDIKDWLDGWDALNVQRKEIEDLWEKVHAGDTASIYKADEKSTDLHELESDFAQSAAEILRELYVNSTLPSERGERAWQHLDGEFTCTSANMLTYGLPHRGHLRRPRPQSVLPLDPHHATPSPRRTAGALSHPA